MREISTWRNETPESSEMTTLLSPVSLTTAAIATVFFVSLTFCSAAAFSDECGADLNNITDPFCGLKGLKLHCSDGRIAAISMGDFSFRVLEINQSAQTIVVARSDPLAETCPLTVVPENSRNLTIFFNCSQTDGQKCRNQTVRLKQRICDDCRKSGGDCGSNDDTSLHCICHGHQEARRLSDESPPGEPATDEPNVKLKVIIGLSSASGSMLLMALSFVIWRCYRRKKYSPSSVISRSISFDRSSLNHGEKGDSCFNVHLFSYDEIEQATEKFSPSREVGDGGFGTVYYGLLRDGRAVAVKRLYENNCKRVKQFKNEVEILARLRHQNLVSLYGCTSHHSRELLLVYEYVPNGTIADHLHGDRANPSELRWPTRMRIAIETASALVYLHASDIIHRDVKTSNILLDDHFCVKVADFGISRLFPADVTHVSTAPQGTPGYVDPEYHECYQLTEKSDVYSFGVVLVELISSKPAVDITRRRHEINLSTMAINKIQTRALHELVDPSLGFESDHEVRKMVTLVAELAFMCLQGGKEARPSMVEVFEALKRIQNKNYNKENAEEIDITADDAALLTTDPPPFSPVSATMQKSSDEITFGRFDH